MMNVLRLAAIGAVALAVHARAGLMQPIDPRNINVIDSPIVSTPTLNMGMVPMTPWRAGVAPQSHTIVPARQAPTKSVEMPTVQKPVLEKEVRPYTDYPTKRAEVSDKVRPSPIAETKRAEIKGRVIRATTPAGVEELKSQLRNSPAPAQ